MYTLGIAIYTTFLLISPTRKFPPGGDKGRNAEKLLGSFLGGEMMISCWVGSGIWHTNVCYIRCFPFAPSVRHLGLDTVCIG